MACRGCSSGDGCNCSVTGSGSVSVTGSGTPVTSPYVVSFNIEAELASVPEDATACASLNDPLVPVLLGDGSVVMVALPCPDFSDIALPGNAFAFTFSGTTTDADPGNGYVRFSSATYSSVTHIYVSDQETNGTDILAWLDSLDDAAGTPKGRIRVYSRQDPTKWADFKLTGVTSATGYRKLVVTYNDHNGTLTNDIGDTVIDFTPASDGSIGGFSSVQDIEAVTGAYTLDLLDAGKYLRCSNASPFSVTVPLNATVAFTIGTHIDLIQSGAGQVTIAATGGVTINASPGLKLNGQWAGATLIKVGTNEWDLIGNLTA